MLLVTLKGILGHKGRVLSTGLAVILGVAFMAGTLTLTDTIETAFNDLFSDVNAGTDSWVRGDTEVDNQFGPSSRNRLDISVLDIVRSVEGVDEAAAEIESFSTYVVASDGDPFVPGNAPAFGRVWPGSDSELNPFVLQPGGRDPLADNEIVMDKATADGSGFVVGNLVPVITPNLGRVDYLLVGVAKFGTADGTLAATQVLFTLPEAQRVLGEVGKIDAIGVAATSGVSDQELTDRIAAVLAANNVSGVEVLTGDEITEENQRQIGQFLGVLRTALVSFALVALLVGAFIIYNTFSILIAQRGREMALLRAIGASRQQVLRSVVVEAAVIGLVASAVGVIAGFGLATVLRALFGAFGINPSVDGFIVRPVTVLVPFLAGMLVTVLSALVPALRAARIPPIAALRDVAIDHSDHSPARARVGLGITGLGAAALILGLTGAGGSAAGLGALATLVGVVVAGPTIAGPIARLLGMPIASRGMPGQLAQQNATRNPKRTASTALALTIGVSLVVFITIFGASVSKSLTSVIEDQFQGDLVVNSGGFDVTGIDPSVTDSIRQHPDVERVSGLRVTPAVVSGPNLRNPAGPPPRFDDGIQAFDAADASVMFDIAGDQQLLGSLGPEDIAISERTASRTGWTNGTVVSVDLLFAGTVDLTVKTIYGDDDLAERYFVDTSVFDANLANSLDVQVFLDLVDPSTAEATAADIEASLETTYPLVQVQNVADYAASQVGFIDQILRLVTMLLAFSILIAGIGITNTLSLSIFERRREIGLLRAVGMTRTQIRRTIRWEAIIVAVLGSLLGLALGLFWGVSLVQSSRGDGFLLSIAPGQLFMILIAGALLGVVASLRPARRATKLDVLTAIASE